LDVGNLFLFIKGMVLEDTAITPIMILIFY